MGLSTGVVRPSILRLAHHRWVRSLVTGTRPGRAVATRFVAGETLADAMSVARDLSDVGLHSMLNLLGEDVEEPEQALRAREAYLRGGTSQWPR